jgi:pimeloyl-ACP methyl ester carboxylesterase
VLDVSLDPQAQSGASPLMSRIAASAAKIAAGDIDGGLTIFFDGIEGEGSWARLPAAPKQQLRDNVYTLIGQVGENRKPFTKAQAEQIKLPTLFVGGADTRGALPAVTRALLPHIRGARHEMIAGASHWMFEQDPQKFCAIVLGFLGQ